MEEIQVERYAKINKHNYLHCLYQNDSLFQPLRQQKTWLKWRGSVSAGKRHVRTGSDWERWRGSCKWTPVNQQRCQSTCHQKFAWLKLFWDDSPLRNRKRRDKCERKQNFGIPAQTQHGRPTAAGPSRRTCQQVLRRAKFQKRGFSGYDYGFRRLRSGPH